MVILTASRRKHGVSFADMSDHSLAEITMPSVTAKAPTPPLSLEWLIACDVIANGQLDVHPAV